MSNQKPGRDKIYLYAPICFFYILVSCTKSEAPGEATYTIKVKEYKTNLPLPGVKIALYHCSNYDAVFGCQSKSVFATHATNQEGEYLITNSELNRADEGIKLSKLQYFDRDGGTGEVFMEPEGWVKVAIKTNKVYPDTSQLVLNVIGELGEGSSLTFKAPKDSTVDFRIFGNETNVINWLVYTTLPPPCLFYCPIDTLAFGTFSLNPKKFEKLAASLDY